jgi:hypothetical protein
MTDERLDRLVRDADPYRPDLIERLDGAEQTLLEEIMSTPELESITTTPPRRSLTWRLAGAAVAAAVAAVVAATTLMPDQPPQNDTWTGAVGLPSGDAGGAGGGYQLDLKAAEGHPRLLIDRPGWKVTTVYGFAEEQGTIVFQNGNREVEMTWYPDEQYQGFYEDRLKVSKPGTATVAGTSASVFTYTKTDTAVMLKPRDGAFVELRAQGPTRTEFDELLAHVVRVDAEAFLKALPPEVVTPGRVGEEAAKILADVPIPPGFDVAAVEVGGANDPYQFGAAVTGQVSCAWIAEWIRADEADDDKARRLAATALRSSHRWKVLNDMNDEGDYPEMVWRVADQVAGGDVPERYKEGLDCR